MIAFVETAVVELRPAGRECNYGEACSDRQWGRKMTLATQVKQLGGGDVLWDGSKNRCEEGVGGIKRGDRRQGGDDLRGCFETNEYTWHKSEKGPEEVILIGFKALPREFFPPKYHYLVVFDSWNFKRREELAV